MENLVRVELTSDEALVLFEFLTRFQTQETLTIQHPAEEQSLWNLQCLLEKKLLEPWLSNYEELLQAARRSLSFEDVD